MKYEINYTCMNTLMLTGTGELTVIAFCDGYVTGQGQYFKSRNKLQEDETRNWSPVY
jgi:hypothetical protein